MLPRILLGVLYLCLYHGLCFICQADLSRSIEKLCSEVTSTLSHLLGDTQLASGEMTAQLMSLLHQMALQTSQKEKLSSLTRILDTAEKENLMTNEGIARKSTIMLSGFIIIDICCILFHYCDWLKVMDLRKIIVQWSYPH